MDQCNFFILKASLMEFLWLPMPINSNAQLWKLHWFERAKWSLIYLGWSKILKGLFKGPNEPFYAYKLLCQRIFLKNEYSVWNLTLKRRELKSKFSDRGCRKTAPNGWNDLKFCMQGSFVGYIWVLAKLRSHSLYGGQTNISHFWHLLSVKYAHSTPR